MGGVVDARDVAWDAEQDTARHNARQYIEVSGMGSLRCRIWCRGAVCSCHVKEHISAYTHALQCRQQHCLSDVLKDGCKQALSREKLCKVYVAAHCRHHVAYCECAGPSASSPPFSTKAAGSSTSFGWLYLHVLPCTGQRPVPMY
jgi:hypothetical protein